MQKFTPKSEPTLTLDDVLVFFPDDKEAAAAAFVSLMQMAEAGLIDLYLPAGWSVVPHRRWNIWIGDDVKPPSGARVTLAEWCGDFRAMWQEERQERKGGAE